jgi:hypothetical protein
LEEAEKAKRDREAAKQAAVKAQLDEEQRRKREEEEKRRREKESMTAALEDAKRKEQARAFQKVPAALVASSATSSGIETSMQRTVVFSPNKAASSTVEQTSISSLVAPTVVPATIFSPAKPVVASSLFGGVKSLISTVGGSFRAQPASFVLKILIPVSLAGIFSPKLKTGTAPAAAVVHTFQAPAPVSQKEIAALGVAAVAAAQESGPTSYDISNDCNRFASLSAAHCLFSGKLTLRFQRRRMQRQREQRKRKEAGECVFLPWSPHTFTKTRPQHAVWSKKEILLPMLKRQAFTNPDQIFGKCPTSVDLAAVFHKEKPRKRRYSQVGALLPSMNNNEC